LYYDNGTSKVPERAKSRCDADPVAIAPGTDLIATSVWLSQNAYDIFSPFKILPVCRSV